MESLHSGPGIDSWQMRNIWAAVMKKIHTGLANKNFNQPSGIVTATICKTTGCIATATCTDTYTDIFTQDNMPDKCQGHGNQDICEESGKIANQYCPVDKVKKVTYGGVVPKEALNLWKPLGNPSVVSHNKVEETCTIHKKPEEPAKVETKKENTNTVSSDKTNTTTTDKTNTTTTNETTSGESASNKTKKQ